MRVRAYVEEGEGDDSSYRAGRLYPFVIFTSPVRQFPSELQRAYGIMYGVQVFLKKMVISKVDYFPIFATGQGKQRNKQLTCIPRPGRVQQQHVSVQIRHFACQAFRTCC